MSDLPASNRGDASQLASVLALLASVLLLTAGTNLQGILLPLRRQMEGSSMQQIGLLSSGWSFGFVLACLVVGRLVSSVGHVRSYAGLAALSAGVTLMLLPLNNEAVWVGLRVIIGFCFGGLSIIIESWLNERSNAGNRGSIFAAYMTVSLLASLGGTLTLAFVDTMAPLPYTLMGVAVVLSIVPVTLTRVPLPRPIEPFRIDLPAMYRVSPTGVTGCFAVGLVAGALGGLLPSYGLAMNLPTDAVAVLIAASLIGGALSYYPAGALSDRVDRRIVIIALSTASAALCAFIALHPLLSSQGILLAIGAFGPAMTRSRRTTRGHDQRPCPAAILFRGRERAADHPQRRDCARTAARGRRDALRAGEPVPVHGRRPAAAGRVCGVPDGRAGGRAGGHEVEVPAADRRAAFDAADAAEGAPSLTTQQDAGP